MEAIKNEGEQFQKQYANSLADINADWAKLVAYHMQVESGVSSSAPGLQTPQTAVASAVAAAQVHRGNHTECRTHTSAAEAAVTDAVAKETQMQRLTEFYNSQQAQQAVAGQTRYKMPPAHLLAQYQAQQDLQQQQGQRQQEAVVPKAPPSKAAFREFIEKQERQQDAVQGSGSTWGCGQCSTGV